MLGFAACQNPSPKPNPAYQVLNQNEAAAALVLDTCEFFFEKITPLEIEIQSGGSIKDSVRATALQAYLGFLRNEALNFESQEAEFVQNCMNQALSLSESAGLNLQDLPTIGLLKMRGLAYGPGIFFTRNANIAIPASNLQNAENLTRVLIHEIFHIYSRYQPEKRLAMYELLGFKALEGLHLNEILIKRALYNPDGVNLRYTLTIQDPQGQERQVIPAIISRHSSHVPEMPFFNYIDFRLFPIEFSEPKIARVLSQHGGWKPEEIQGFFEQVGRNTRYIIHPDEILADNFVLLAYRKTRPETIAKLSPQGKTLLDNLAQIIQQR